MPIDPERLLSHSFAERRTSYQERDAILYALCCGAGPDSLPLVHEDGLRVIPSFGQNLSFDDSWMDATGIDLARVVHGGLDLRLHRPFAASATIAARTRIAGLVDKGPGKAGLVLVETVLHDDGEPIFTSRSTLFVMGGGGFGGDRGEVPEVVQTPDRAPDLTAQVATRTDAPLLFRLLGDRNPLHVLPEAARAAGFPGPIMHGANTFGIVCREALEQFADSEPARMHRIAARFSGPLFPGETLEISFWREGDGLRFTAGAVERNAPVLAGGLVELG